MPRSPPGTGKRSPPATTCVLPSGASATNAPRALTVTGGFAASATRTAWASLVQALHPVCTRLPVLGSRSGAPAIPMVGPCFCSAILSSGTKFTSNLPSAPRISRAEVVLMTG